MNPAPYPSATLIYFSPTHNTQKVLRAIAQGMGLEQTVELDLTSPAARSNPLPPVTSDLLVVGMPVYEAHLPALTLPILKKMEGRGQPAAVVVVYGNIGFGHALQELAAVAGERGFQVAAGAAFIGEHSFSYDRLPLALGRPDQEDLRTARSFGERITAKLNDLPPVPAKKGMAMPGTLPLIPSILPPNSSALFAHPPVLKAEACNHCGACVQACPVGAIDPDDLRIDGSKCLRCFACRQGALKISLRNKWISYPFLKASGIRSHPQVPGAVRRPTAFCAAALHNAAAR